MRIFIFIFDRCQNQLILVIIENFRPICNEGPFTFFDNNVILIITVILFCLTFSGNRMPRHQCINLFHLILFHFNRFHQFLCQGSFQTSIEISLITIGFGFTINIKIEILKFIELPSSQGSI
jgi:hypothetical protein